MSAKKGGLGKGLDSLISNKVSAEQLNTGNIAGSKNAVSMVKVSLVEPNREQPRKHFDEGALSELADSIRQHGIVQPLIVRKKDGYYEIIAGERRWRAARIAGLKEIPVIVREFSEQEKTEISLIENIQREDLNPIEEARAYKTLMEEFHLKQDELAKRVSKSRTAVTNAMRLLKLCGEVQQMVIDGKLTGGHARCLISIEDPDMQVAVASQISKESLSVRDTEKLVKNLQRQKTGVKREKEEPDEKLLILCENMAEQMKQILGTKVSVQPKNNDTGKIEIEYYSQDDLDRILRMMRTMKPVSE